MDQVPQHDPAPDANLIPPEKARQAEISLRSRPQRAIFLFGLILPLVILVVTTLWYVL